MLFSGSTYLFIVECMSIVFSSFINFTSPNHLNRSYLQRKRKHSRPKSIDRIRLSITQLQRKHKSNFFHVFRIQLGTSIGIGIITNHGWYQGIQCHISCFFFCLVDKLACQEGLRLLGPNVDLFPSESRSLYVLPSPT